MTSMIATCSLDRKNLDVSCIIIIVTVKYLSSTALRELDECVNFHRLEA